MTPNAPPCSSDEANAIDVDGEITRCRIDLDLAVFHRRTDRLETGVEQRRMQMEPRRVIEVIGKLHECQRFVGARRSSLRPRNPGP